MITDEERAALIAENAAWFACQVQERHMAHVDRPATCRKRAFDSEAAARAAHTTGDWRIRAYRCPNCRRYHVTNGDKHTSWKGDR